MKIISNEQYKNLTTTANIDRSKMFKDYTWDEIFEVCFYGMPSVSLSHYYADYIYKLQEENKKLKTKLNDKRGANDESPYCEVCGTCGYIGCCGIRNFIKEHIEGKTNCKNEACIIDEIISLCEYKNDVFKENEKLLNFKNAWEELKEYITKENITIQGIEVLEQEDLIDKMQELEQKYNIGGE